jgi:hypothetical protein
VPSFFHIVRGMKIAETKGKGRLTSNALDAPCHDVPRGADDAKWKIACIRMATTVDVGTDS